MKSKEKLLKIKIILVEPNGPINVGSIARLCSNFEVDQLRIVSPKCNIFSLEAKKMALKGYTYIDNCEVYHNLINAISDCNLVLATSGRSNISNSNNESLQQVSKWINSYKNISDLAIVFGREDRGLTNEELLMSQKIINIETHQNYCSLNLSHAVSIVLYELNKKKNDDNTEDKKPFNLASSIQIENAFTEIQSLLMKVGYLLNHTSKAKIIKFKKYILRANTTKDEVNLIRGIVHQINWALKNLK